MSSLFRGQLVGVPLEIMHPTMAKDTTYTKIFVGGLPYHTNDASLRKYFESFGDIDEAVVITDKQTGKSRGYGFVSENETLLFCCLEGLRQLPDPLFIALWRTRALCPRSSCIGVPVGHMSARTADRCVINYLKSHKVEAKQTQSSPLRPDTFFWTEFEPNLIM